MKILLAELNAVMPCASPTSLFTTCFELRTIAITLGVVKLLGNDVNIW